MQVCASLTAVGVLSVGASAPDALAASISLAAWHRIYIAYNESDIWYEAGH